MHIWCRFVKKIWIILKQVIRGHMILQPKEDTFGVWEIFFILSGFTKRYRNVIWIYKEYYWIYIANEGQSTFIALEKCFFLTLLYSGTSKKKKKKFDMKNKVTLMLSGKSLCFDDGALYLLKFSLIQLSILHSKDFWLILVSGDGKKTSVIRDSLETWVVRKQ